MLRLGFKPTTPVQAKKKPQKVAKKKLPGSHLKWGFYRHEEIEKYLPKTPEGAKGWGLEGHKLPEWDIYKGDEPTVIKAPEEYPKWLLEEGIKPRPSFEELAAQDFDSLPPQEQRRFKKMIRRKKIKEQNILRAK
eukprot:gb/GECH01005698.1/.p1 GENE.gb/GECH01005698.1/~~gb/GECH01005698.1/.p1  ORF type:complete len:135 (+),score=42.16 gb/GECH01005698.1/:1-405(+)